MARGLHCDPTVLRKSLTAALTLVVALTAVAAVADALVLTDEERLDDVVDALTSTESGRRLDSALRYFACDREEVTVRTPDVRDTFGDGDEVNLSSTLRRELRFLETDDVETLQSSVTVDGDAATVSMRLVDDGTPRDLTLQLNRHRDRWLVRHFRLR